ncbi:NADH-quinone oxidoreductase subunit L [Shinella sp. H4-D48]|uniref:NADH-quinone oxidoreductase subunit L n=1 Tax=Shinella sp. H4-D48 TaxID=2925841 RepID=UPI001F52D062|nr:NADH-quinone oxidoreductase subunit L [Shinella sp. H4-D48]UNK36910.1 NADH-quinone oxidoreductase subunit L [Shinella sp. H4-D48]
MDTIIKAIVFLPLIGFLIAGIGGNAIGAKASEYVTSGFMIIAAVLSWIVFFDVAMGETEMIKVSVLRWIQSGNLDVEWAFRVDTLTAVMFVVVNTVSTLVHIYSIGYMHHDPHRPRFFAYLSLFTFAMLMLVTADNLLQMFFGWEGVGLASYLLIGFWYKKPSASAAAMKAFIVNRVGDFGFILGISCVFVLFGSINFETIFATAATYLPAEGAANAAEPVINLFGMSLDKSHALTATCLLLFMGAMGKSAQFLLHTWLPDAMEGPTPVSALIHAATMVTAGVFLVARMSPVFELSHDALMVVTLVGAITAFFAATVGLVQNDIKRVIAYSTCSQLGYMFVALGIGAYGAAVFHLFTHAFFKALLFLGAGSVIHAVDGEQDMRYMGGLRKHIPITFWMMTIGTLALTGVGIPGTVIGFAGFFSKDAIIESTFASHSPVAGFAFVLLVIAALFTSFYSWRLAFMTFFGKPRASADVMHHVHESPAVMLIPLYILGAGAIGAGVIFVEYFYGHHYGEFWQGALFTLPGNDLVNEYHHVPLWVKWSPFAAMALGFVTAWYMYIRSPETPKYLAEQHRGLYQFLLNKWYFDELYDFLFVRSAKALGRFLWKKGDGAVIDGFGPNGVAARVVDVTDRVVRLQTGYLYHYAFAMLLGIAALVTWMMLGSSL